MASNQQVPHLLVCNIDRLIIPAYTLFTMMLHQPALIITAPSLVSIRDFFPLGTNWCCSSLFRRYLRIKFLRACALLAIRFSWGLWMRCFQLDMDVSKANYSMWKKYSKENYNFNFVCANHVGEVSTLTFSTAVCGKAMIARFSYFWIYATWYGS